MKSTAWDIVVCLAFFALVSCPSRGIAEVNVNIGVNIGPPPPIVISSPPPVFVIPETYVYFIPDIEVDLFFYHGYWYRPYQDRWYRATVYNGPWVFVEPDRVPGVVLHVPPDFRRVPPGHQMIPYGQLKKNWKTWEKNKYWDKRDKHEANVEHGGKKGKGKHKGKD